MTGKLPSGSYTIRLTTDPYLRSDVSSTVSDLMRAPGSSARAESDDGNRTPTHSGSPLSLSQFSLVGHPVTPPPSDLLDSVWVPLVPKTPGVLPDNNNPSVVPPDHLAPSPADVLPDSRTSMVPPGNLGPSTPNVLPNHSTTMVPHNDPVPIATPLPLPNTQLTIENAPESPDIKVAAAEKKAWKEINEEAGGSIQRYHDMTIEKINNGRNGMIFPPEAAIPDEGELVGDKKPEYEAMTLTEKMFAWWTKKQWKIFNDTVNKEVCDH